MKLRITIIAIFFAGLVNAQVDSTRTDSLTLNAEDFVILSGDQLEDDSQGQGLSGLLYSSNDVFASKAIFQFRSSRFNARGLNNDHFTASLNGITMNDPELGFAIWANWGGLNDITRRPESKTGVASNDYNFSGIAGFSNIDIKASTKRVGTRFSYALTNRSYRNRAMLTHNTGLMENDVAISASASGRWAEEGYIEGTSYNAASYYLSIEKKLDDKKSVGIVGFGAPAVTGRAGIFTQEAYDLKDNNYYNSYWGFQDGEKRNSRLRKSHKPIAIVWFENRISDKTKYMASAYMQTGKYGQTRLSWYTGRDPRGEYYRNLPSFNEYSFDPEVQAQQAEVTDYWTNDETAGQLDWDQMYFANSKDLHLTEDADGIQGNDITFLRAKYMVEENRIDPTLIGLNLNFSHELKENISLDFGLHANKYKSENYQLANDLLGAEYWLNINRFAERDFGQGTDAAQQDLDVKNRLVAEGERFGYDYDMHISKVDLFGQIAITEEKFDVYGAVNFGTTSFYRDGNLKNGLFPSDSQGESEKISNPYGGVKAGLVYKINGRQFIEANGNFSSRAPKVRTSFISPRTRNEIADDIENEKILAYDVSYIIRHPKMKARATFFNIAQKDLAKTINLYFDERGEFGTLRLSDVNYLNTGIELGIERHLSKSVTVSSAYSMGQYIYDSRPLLNFTVDNNSERIIEDQVVYFQNYKQGRMPQTVANIGAEYNSSKFWRVGFDFNYFGDVWLDANPIRRTEEALESYAANDPNVNEVVGRIIDQTQLDDGFTLNMNAGKTWKFDDKLLLLVLNANNLLDFKDFATGFEQSRYDNDNDEATQNIDRYPPRVGFMYGRTFFLMVRLDF